VHTNVLDGSSVSDCLRPRRLVGAVAGGAPSSELEAIAFSEVADWPWVVVCCWLEDPDCDLLPLPRDVYALPWYSESDPLLSRSLTNFLLSFFLLALTDVMSSAENESVSQGVGRPLGAARSSSKSVKLSSLRSPSSSGERGRRSVRCRLQPLK